MTWTYPVPMRWADIDWLQHVNNVAYTEYAAEALVELQRAGVVPDELPGRVVVTYLAPLQHGAEPVVVTAREGDVVSQEIRSGDVVHARVVSTYAEPTASRFVPDAAAGPLPIQVRMADLSSSGVVSLPKRFELMQESRVALVRGAIDGLETGPFVVGTLSLDLMGDLLLRTDPYQVRGWLSRVGTASADIEVAIVDGTETLLRSTCTIVAFDATTQRSRRFTDAERASIEAHVL